MSRPLKCTTQHGGNAKKMQDTFQSQYWAIGTAGAAIYQRPSWDVQARKGDLRSTHVDQRTAHQNNSGGHSVWFINIIEKSNWGPWIELYVSPHRRVYFAQNCIFSTTCLRANPVAPAMCHFQSELSVVTGDPGESIRTLIFVRTWTSWLM